MIRISINNYSVVFAEMRKNKRHNVKHVMK